MGKDQGKPSSRPSSRPPSSRGPRTRRESVRREQTKLRASAIRLLLTPNALWAVSIVATFIMLAGLLAVVTREQPLVGVGRVMNETRTVRVGFTMVDNAETQNARETKRQRTPWVYDADVSVLENIQSSLENLPKTLSAVESLADVEAGIREQFQLSEEGFTAIKAISGDPDQEQSWRRSVGQVVSLLKVTPLLEDQAWQRAQQEGLHQQVQLQAGEASNFSPRSRIEFVKVNDPAQVTEAMTNIVDRANFESEPLSRVVINRLTVNPQVTYRFNAALTTERQNFAAASVEPVMREIAVGQKVFTRGDVLTQTQLNLYREEIRQFHANSAWWQVWLRRISVFGAVGAIAAAMGGYIALFVPKIRRKPSRMGWIGVLMLIGLAVACWGTSINPWLIGLTAVAPTILVSVILVIAYDQRVALAMGVLHGVLTCIALDQRIGMFALIITGTSVAVWSLHEIRDRRALIRMGVGTGAALAIATLLVAVIDRPIEAQSLMQALTDAGTSAFGGLLVGGIALFILPSIEKTFDITTGMTLIELRDPKQPLLRELLQRAPGTYNHSLNVASIAETAADAIGADALLTYVGALYHDIGKMNKPEYFVENQAGGPNKHEKLSPAMSLLVIVGHVKDGVEMAREYGLPRTLQHFIEAHHGTTLVEYFYHRAKKQAGAGAATAPTEFEYRYPGPKPQTKEVAILMLSDGVESATRAMAEPTPSRIDALVREMANKRLVDGQFDQCDLTLRELSTIVDSVSKSLASIHHGRIAYPEKHAATESAGGAEERSA